MAKSTLYYLPHPLIIALLAGTLEVINLLSVLFVGWIGFASWACYFVFVTDPSFRTSLKLLACWLAGVIAAILVLQLASLFFIGRLGLSVHLAFPISLMIVAFCVICFEKVAFLDWIPAWFIGSASFFALHDESLSTFSEYRWEVLQLLIGCCLGQLFGFLSVFFRGRYQSYIDSI